MILNSNSIKSFPTHTRSHKRAVIVVVVFEIICFPRTVCVRLGIKGVRFKNKLKEKRTTKRRITFHAKITIEKRTRIQSVIRKSSLFATVLLASKHPSPPRRNHTSSVRQRVANKFPSAALLYAKLPSASLSAFAIRVMQMRLTRLFLLE
jgi:hypothetical protein